MITAPQQVPTVSQIHPPGSFNLADHPVPTGQEEFWRFTPLDRLVSFFEAEVRGSLWPTIDYGPQLGQDSLFLGPAESPRGTVLIPIDRLSAIAASVDRAAYLRIEDDLVDPVHVQVHGQPAAHLSADHLVIEARPGTAATVVITHTGHGLHIGNVEILVGADAKLTVVSIQDWQPGSIHLGQHEALVGSNATYRHIGVTMGGDIVRLQNNVSYASSGGEAELLGVYFAQCGQHLEHRLFVDHNHPKGVSHVDYRGALQGDRARSVWVGDVLIRPQALGIETYEANKNLILTDGCRADAVPNLEIQTGEIGGAGHSASTGRFDDEQLFYLRSRGIPEDEARHLMVRGFFSALLARIGIADVEQTWMDRIDSALNISKENS
jgi:Fe-S cluster assembly protein SufD